MGTSTFDLESFVLGDLLASRAISHKTEPFLLFYDGQITFGEVDEMANRVARGLIASGVGPGSHVALMLPNCADLLYAIFALARLGAVAVPINTAYRGEMLKHVLNSSDSTMLIIDADYVDQLAPLADRLPSLQQLIVRSRAESDPANAGLVDKGLRPWSELLNHGSEAPQVKVGFHNLMAIMYTSGTTGPSKGAMCSHALALTCAYDSLNYLDRWGETIYCPLPLFHAAGLWDGVMSALIAGSPIALVDRFHASTFWDDVRMFNAGTAISVFSMIPILLKQPPSPRDKDHPLKRFYMGKSTLDAALYQRFGVHSVETYTSTEVGIATGSPYGEWKIGSCGTANDERFQLAVVDEYDREVGHGAPGELVVRPKQPFVMTTGYYGTPETTAERFRNMWFHTGDRVWRDKDGYFYFLDRMKDSIRRRGENISAFDLECEVNTHPSVLESAAIGVPSELEDEDVKLAVVLQPGEKLEAEELLRFCQQQLPHHMVPRYIEFLDSLPRTPTDKVSKYRLREQGNRGITTTTWDREGRRTTVKATTTGKPKGAEKPTPSDNHKAAAK